MDVRLPKLGEGAESGSVVSILVKEGDRIEAGQSLIELENEKAVAAIPSPAAGTVAQVRVKEGDRLSVGGVILVLTVAGEAPAAPAPAPAGAPPRKSAAAGAGPALTVPPPSPEPEPEPSAVAEPPLESALPPAASPSLRHLARELGIDLRRVKGSEAGGRIVMADVRAYLQRLMRLAEQGRPAATPSAKPAPARIDFAQWGPVVNKPLSVLRKTIAQHMTENWNTIPHVHQFDAVDLTDLDGLRRKFAPAYEAAGARLTLTSFALVALARALKKHPLFNASLDEVGEAIVLKSYYHFGLAVDTEAGLIVPVIRNVDQKTLVELSKDVTTAATKARDRKVTLDDLRGGTFTISNQGGLGGGAFTPIINKPEVAILGLGRAVLKPVIKQGAVVPRLMMPLCVGYDHRLIDGGSAARFVVDLVAAFEGFSEADVKL